MDDIDDFLPSDFSSSGVAAKSELNEAKPSPETTSPAPIVDDPKKSNLFQRISTRLHERTTYLPKSHSDPIGELNDIIIENQFTIKALQKVTQEELDIIRLAALFNARNGRGFFTTLLSHQRSNPRFSFLLSSHPHFPFFKHLTEIYSNLLPPSTLALPILNTLDSPQTILNLLIPHAQNAHRNKLIALHEALLQHDDDQISLTIDWGNFVLASDPIVFSGEDESMLLPEPRSSLADIERMIHAQDLTQALERSQQEQLKEQQEANNRLHSSIDDIDDYMDAQHSAYNDSTNYYQQKNSVQLEDEYIADIAPRPVGSSHPAYSSSVPLPPGIKPSQIHGEPDIVHTAKRQRL